MKGSFQFFGRVNFFIIFAHPYYQMCNKIYIFKLKKTNTQKRKQGDKKQKKENICEKLGYKVYF